MSWRNNAAVVAIMALAGASSCSKPAEVGPGSGSEPDARCPGGRPAAARLIVRAELGEIRPLDATKLVRVEGTRRSDETSCFAEDGVESFTVRLEEDSPIEIMTQPLAHGAWELSIVPPGDGGHPIPSPIARVLQPGGSYVLTVAGSDDGDLQVEMTP